MKMIYWLTRINEAELTKFKANIKEVQCYCCQKFDHHTRNYQLNKESNANDR